MSGDIQKFHEAMDLYEETFGDRFPIMEIADKPINEMTKIVMQYIESGEPYLEDLQYMDADELELYKADMLYKKTFGKHFPTMHFRGKTFKEMAEIALQYVKDGKPYKLNLPKGAKI